MANIKKRVLRGGAGFLTSNLLEKGLGFLFIIICSRLLGAEQFGIYSIGLSVAGLTANIGLIGLPNTIQRFLSGKGEKRVKYLYGGILLISFISIFIISIGLYLISPFLALRIFDESQLTNILQVFSFGVAVTIGIRILKSILQAQEKIKEIIIGNALTSILKILLLFIFFLWTKEALSAVLAYIISFIITFVYFSRSLLKIRFKPIYPHLYDLKNVLKYSAPLVLVGFSYFLMQQSDRLMLGWLSTSRDVGIYTAISTLAMVMSIFHSSLISIFMPVASESYREGKISKLGEVYLIISKWVGRFNGLMILVFASAGIWILGLLGDDYANHLSYQVLLLLSFLYYLGTSIGPTGALLQMTDGNRIEFYNTLIFITLNVLLNYFLIIKYGLLGAAIATFISGVIRNILQAIEIKYYYKINVINRSNALYFIIVVLGVLSCYVLEELRLYLLVFFTLIILINTYLSLNEDEIQFINRSVKNKLL